MDPADLDVGVIEPDPGQHGHHGHLQRPPLDRRHTGGGVRPAMHPAIQERLGAGVELFDRAGRVQTSALRGRSLSGPGTVFRSCPCAWRLWERRPRLAVPCRRAKSNTFGCSLNRRPCDDPSAPIRSVREKYGTPPAASKNRTRPSSVWCWSIEEANHQCRNLDHDKMAPKHCSSPSPERLAEIAAVAPVELTLFARGPSRSAPTPSPPA